MKKVLFFLPNFMHGGAEGVIVDVCNYFSSNNIKVVLVVANNRGPLKSKINDNVKIICLNEYFWISFISLSKIIGLEKPEYILTTMKECSFIACLAKSISLNNSELIIREANTVSLEKKFENKLKQKIKNFFCYQSYRFADRIIVLSQTMRSDLIKELPFLVNKNINVINNPVDIQNIKVLAEEEIPVDELKIIQGRDFFINVARLDPQKNYEFLIDALCEYKKRGNDFVFFAIGQGSLKDFLKAKVVALGLEKNFYFIGYRSNPFKYMYRADVFILPSHFEGLSNSLIQATALGVPALYSDSQTSSKEWVEKHNVGISYKYNDVNDFLINLEKLKSKGKHIINLEDLNTLSSYLNLIK
ncbi:glycosyltransferase [Comamonas aquatica]|uniref:Glycosyltransferase n=1 Tax=Comamonas aquatica TaxID=225991 RepID=A0AA42HWS7_9BURK|nr:glycosyltransferase [Comamonas aquatica]MDH0363112.1 glycosyltransferase [Comamonas aquatica]